MEKIKGMFTKVKESIVKAWEVSAKYVAGTAFIAALVVGALGLITLIAARVEGGYAMLEGYSLMATCFGFLLSVPLGLLFKLSLEEDI